MMTPASAGETSRAAAKKDAAAIWARSTGPVLQNRDVDLKSNPVPLSGMMSTQIDEGW